MRSKRTVAVDISQDVRKRVKERDFNRCIFCHTDKGLTIAHIIARSNGGLGVEENLVTACCDCHYRMDFTYERTPMKIAAKKYIMRIYGSFNENEVIFNKKKGE